MPTDETDSDDEWQRERAEEEEDRRRKEEPPPKLGETEFLTWRSPRLGSSNPTRLENPLWNWLVRTRWDAYNANNLYAGPSPFDGGPMWTFRRFGKSEAALADGRIVHIGGEHEDYYDPDFFIYNDVVLVDPTGQITIFGYPGGDFPPTDFHSATQVGDAIYIIGRLGYPDSRVANVTPVYKLSLDSMQIQAVETLGIPPGWIYRHSGLLSDDGHTIIVSGGERWLGNDCATRKNVDSWAFDTQNREWHRLTARNWQQWIMRRVDRKPNRLWDVRQALWHRDHAHLGLENHWSFDDEPDFLALEMLYRTSDSSPPPTEGSDVGSFSIVVDGLTVRFKEDRLWIEAIVEGQLDQERLSALQNMTLALLERLDRAKYEIEEAQVANRRASQETPPK